jgi:magnesium chelatase subunit I
MTDSTPRPTTLGELRTSGWRDRSVKEELRHNVIARLRRGEELFPGILGFEDTVLPSLERALLAGHDIVLLGERGQAKTRLIRALVDLLDPALPTIAGGEVNDSPFNPVSAHAIAQVAELGDATPVAWLPRERRYGEKLATPDTSVADLIGDVDPIRVAEGRYLSDEFVIHYGLVPRTNRGIFSINELPDLPARIQVALFNVLEERDVQIRGFQVRMPIDVLLVATANPEDYTNRGRIITPLKDRFGSEIRTHYPVDPAHEIQIMEQEANLPDTDVAVRVPEFMEEILAEFSRLARRSPHINQRAGVSVRLSIANLETVAASAVRRAIRCGEDEAVPRICDLPATLQSSGGRIEFETFEEDRKDDILTQLMGHAVLEVFVERLQGHEFRWITQRFGDDGLTIEAGDVTPAADVVGPFAESPDLAVLLRRLGIGNPTLGTTAAAVEFALEGLHLSRRLNKTQVGRGDGRYSATLSAL